MAKEVSINKGKQPTKDDLKRLINRAVVFVPKDKETKSIYFDDRGLRLTVTMDFAIIETNFHRHVFNAVTAQGFSRPYLYTKQFIDIAEEVDCIVKDEKGNPSRSYTLLMNKLKDDEDKTRYNICWLTDLFFFNIFTPLYELDESRLAFFMVYERYIHNIARTSFLLSEHKEDVTNHQIIDEICQKLQEFKEGLEEQVVLEGKTDEERQKEEIEALAQDEQEQQIQEQIKDGKWTMGKRQLALSHEEMQYADDLQQD